MTHQDLTPTNSAGVPHDQAFLEFVVKELVDHPEEVRVERKVDEMGVLLTLDVHPDDMGKVIGRSGNTARAIRSLLRTIGVKYHARVNLKINEPDRAAGRPDHAAREIKDEVGASKGRLATNEVSPDESLEEAMADFKAH
ncbi:MAG: hypothetical protein KatS3mg100_703 [Candidatus Parcubacteria bacterium]|nr:MAG: hypothetical protein KatS3mg100_703 [Candidatus Parcubacteria bacterium]